MSRPSIRLITVCAASCSLGVPQAALASWGDDSFLRFFVYQWVAVVGFSLLVWIFRVVFRGRYLVGFQVALIIAALLFIGGILWILNRLGVPSWLLIAVPIWAYVIADVVVGAHNSRD